jgi:hypothetical protein
MTWKPNRLIAVCLGLWIALAPGVAAASAAVMTHKVGLSSESSSTCPDCCPDDSKATNACPSICLNSSPFVTPAQRDTMLRAVFHGDYSRERASKLSSLAIPPDPPPPRPVAPG